MDQHGTFVATILRSTGKAHAAGAVLRMTSTDARAVATFGTSGFAELRDLAEGLVAHVGEAVVVDRAELYADHVQWLEQSFAARELPLDALRALLVAVRDELADALPRDAAVTATRVADVGLSRFGSQRAGVPSTLGDDADSDRVRRYLGSALAGDAATAARVAEEPLAAGADVSDVLAAVVARAQVELGRMWQRGEIDAGEEHVASRATEHVMSALRARSTRAPRVGRRVLVTTVSGDLHDIGLRMVADQFETSGWDVVYLGASTPARDVARAAVQRDVDLVALSAKLVLHVRATADAIEAVRAATPDRRVPVLVGGRPFEIVPDLWRLVGADGCASSAREAVTTAERIVAGESAS